MSVKCDMDEGETQNSGCMQDVTCLEVRYQCSYPGGSGTVHGSRWDRNLCTWMEMSRHMDGEETNLGIWKLVRQDLDGGEAHILTRMSLIWAWFELICIFLGLDGEEKVHWRNWCKNLETWMQMRQGQDIGEAHILRSGWVWDWIWMELKCRSRDLDGTETSPGWRWVANIRTWIEVRHDMNIDETWI